MHLRNSLFFSIVWGLLLSSLLVSLASFGTNEGFSFGEWLMLFAILSSAIFVFRLFTVWRRKRAFRKHQQICSELLLNDAPLESLPPLPDMPGVEDKNWLSMLVEIPSGWGRKVALPILLFPLITLSALFIEISYFDAINRLEGDLQKGAVLGVVAIIFAANFGWMRLLEYLCKVPVPFRIYRLPLAKTFAILSIVAVLMSALNGAFFLIFGVDEEDVPVVTISSAPLPAAVASTEASEPIHLVNEIEEPRTEPEPPPAAVDEAALQVHFEQIVTAIDTDRVDLLLQALDAGASPNLQILGMPLLFLTMAWAV